MLAHALAALVRRDGGRILASLIRHLGEFDLAEEAMQDAYEKALARWPRDGVPDDPAAWLYTVARNRGLDLIRKRAPLRALDDAMPAAEAAPHDDHPFGTQDDRLRLIFTCCHPALAQSAQIALTLRCVCQLETREIARAFVEPEATTAQKLVRAKRKIAQARIPYAIPAREELAERAATVLAVIYLVFNEGYASTAHDALHRPDLAGEAIRLARELEALLPAQAEALGLLALMLFHHSRRDARVDAGGALLTLEEQDRTRWDAAMIAEGSALLDRALRLREPGPYQIQAAIAALHATSGRAEVTDWAQISALYGALLRHVPTAIVELNAAVALAMAHSIEEGLAWIDRIDARGGLECYAPLHAARADLLRRLGREADAAASYRRAIQLTANAVEAEYFERRLREALNAL
jgi:RNA polymerase sigma-70 factor (ECF subfamily)